MKQFFVFISFYISLIFPLENVKQLDIDKFMGKWYVISSIPNFIDKGHINAYDVYEINQNGKVSIEYYAEKKGKKINFKQEATIIDTINHSRWIIKFIKPWIPLFKVPYEVIILDVSNYYYMVIGYPGNNFGWIMCRNNIMDNNLYSQILNKLETEFNYEKEKFQLVVHENN